MQQKELFCQNKKRKYKGKTVEQVHSDNDASEVDILGHLGTFWDILGQLGSLFDKFGASRLFSQSFPTVFSHNRLIEKKTCDGRTNGPTDGQTLL